MDHATVGEVVRDAVRQEITSVAGKASAEPFANEEEVGFQEWLCCWQCQHSAISTVRGLRVAGQAGLAVLKTQWPRCCGLAGLRRCGDGRKFHCECGILCTVCGILSSCEAVIPVFFLLMYDMDGGTQAARQDDISVEAYPRWAADT